MHFESSKHVFPGLLVEFSSLSSSSASLLHQDYTDGVSFDWALYTKSYDMSKDATQAKCCKSKFMG